jgi:hypothetical protein
MVSGSWRLTMETGEMGRPYGEPPESIAVVAADQLDRAVKLVG